MHQKVWRFFTFCRSFVAHKRDIYTRRIGKLVQIWLKVVL